MGCISAHFSTTKCFAQCSLLFEKQKMNIIEVYMKGICMIKVKFGLHNAKCLHDCAQSFSKEEKLWNKTFQGKWAGKSSLYDHDVIVLKWGQLDINKKNV